MLLKNKVVYVVVTGATKAKTINFLLSHLKLAGAECIIIPTNDGYNLLDHGSISKEWIKL